MGVLRGTDTFGIDWLELPNEQGYVAAFVAEQVLPGFPDFPAQRRLGCRKLSGDACGT